MKAKTPSIYRAEHAKGKAARMAIPPVARDFYDAQYSLGAAWRPYGRHMAPRDTFIGLECRVCRAWLDEGHRPSCPVPKAERALAKARKGANP